MNTIPIRILILMSVISPACAQTITIGGSGNLPEAYSVRLPIRVSESFAAPLSNDASLEQSIEAGRRQLYKLMQDECTTLSESFKAECRIASFSITLGRNYGPAAGSNASVPQIRSIEASVSYGLKVSD